VLTLVLDTATPAVTAALASISEDGPVTVLAERVTVDARAHGELLAPAIAEVLRTAGVAARELSAVVAGVGPGPFTGLRVGLVTAAALADTLTIPVYGVCTLDALGWAAATSSGGAQAEPGFGGAEHPQRDPAGARPVLVATDARRHEVYWAVYRDGSRIAGPAVNKPSDVDTSGIGFAVGDGALRYADVLGVPVRDEPRYPPAAGLASLAAARVRDGQPAEPLTPLYLRRPDAVVPGARKAVS
jgi:tRNA threonylcarbamoyl adenosine modification protein YeaZ